MIQYPETIEEVGRGNLILAANSKMQPLVKTDFDEGVSPLKTYKPWSCLSLNFANSEKGTGGSGAIEVKQLSDVRIRTEIAMKAVMEEEIKKESQQEETSTTEELVKTNVYYLLKDMSEYRGKSAIEIAKNFPITKVLEAAENLKKSAANNPKYADKNMKQANALEVAAIIVNAENAKCNDGKSVLELFSGDLREAMKISQELFNTKHPASQAAVSLFQLIQKDNSVVKYIKKCVNGNANITDTGYKIYGPILKTPNTKKVDKEGYTKAYSLCIVCDPKRLPYPFHIELQTMRGKPSNGKVGIEAQSVVDRKTFTIDLATWEWVNIIEKADWEAKLVALDAHSYQYAAATKATEENIRAHQNKSGPNTIPTTAQIPQAPQNFQTPPLTTPYGTPTYPVYQSYQTPHPVYQNYPNS